MTYICQFRGCELFESCPVGHKLTATPESYSDEDTGERLFDAICDEVDHIETGIPESALAVEPIASGVVYKNGKFKSLSDDELALPPSSPALGRYEFVELVATGKTKHSKVDDETADKIAEKVAAKLNSKEMTDCVGANTKALTNLGRKLDAVKSDVKTVAIGLATIFPDLGACTKEEAKKAFRLLPRYVGLDKIPSTVHRAQIEAAINYSYKKGFAVHIPKQNGTTEHPTITDLAKTVWDLNQGKWQIIPDSYKTLTDYTSALQHHFKEYPDSLLHAD